MLVVNVVFGTAPMTASFFSPPLKIMTVGILRIPYSLAVEGLSSVFSWKNLNLPAYSCDSSPMTGWIIRHGPHQGAQNSTKTGKSDSITSDFHVLSVTAGTWTAVSCASQTTRPPRRTDFDCELRETGDRTGWNLSPLNWEKLTEERRPEDEEEFAIGAKRADEKAEARGTAMVSNTPAIEIVERETAMCKRESTDFN